MPKRSVTKLSDKLLKTLKPEAGKRTDIAYDSEVPGFGVRVTETGAKSFILNYYIAGRERRMTIGKYPAWSLTAARQEAKELRKQIDRGIDPLGEKEEARNAVTMRDLWKYYEEQHLPTLTSEHTRKDHKAMFNNFILPHFGELIKIAEVTHRDASALHRKITQAGKPTRANRVLEVARKAFNLAVRSKWIDDNPCTGFKRNEETRRERYYTSDEIGSICDALSQSREKGSANAIRLLLLTGARRREVLAATWSQFNLEEGRWVKPSSHTKQRKTHTVPLCKEAVQLLQRMHDEKKSKSDYIFPNHKGGHLVDVKKTWQTVCTKAELQDARLHDIRHSFASILVSAGESLPMIGKLLGHTQAQTTMRYSHLYEEPQRVAVEKVSRIVTNKKAEPASDQNASTTASAA